MGEPQIRFRTADEFLEWDLDQPDCRHELVDGIPQAMTGAKTRHDQIVVNVLAELRTRLRGGPCRASTADSGVKIPNGNVRRPDAAVDCGSWKNDDLALRGPKVIVEVLSKSTRLIDHHRKLEDYKLLPTLRAYLMVEQQLPRVTVLRRREGAEWEFEEFTGLDTEIPLDDPAMSLPLADLYDGVDLDATEVPVSPSPR